MPVSLGLPQIKVGCRIFTQVEADNRTKAARAVVGRQANVTIKHKIKIKTVFKTTTITLSIKIPIKTPLILKALIALKQLTKKVPLVDKHSKNLKPNLTFALLTNLTAKPRPLTPLRITPLITVP